MTTLSTIIKSLTENPRTPHYIQNSELKKYMTITAKQIKLKSDVVIVEYEEQTCIVIYDESQNIYRLKLLPQEFDKVFKHFIYDIEFNSVYRTDLEDYKDFGNLVMYEYNDTFIREGYKFDSNGYTIKTINDYRW